MVKLRIETNPSVLDVVEFTSKAFSPTQFVEQGGGLVPIGDPSQSHPPVNSPNAMSQVMDKLLSPCAHVKTWFHSTVQTYKDKW